MNFRLNQFCFREFHQSFLKYWIPFSVQEYKKNLYLFLRSQSVSDLLLVEVLFELRRKRFISVENLSEGEYYEDFSRFISNLNERAFEILCTFTTTNETIPSKFLEMFNEHFLGNKTQYRNLEKYVSQFLTHIFISEHINIQKNSTDSTELNRIYDNFMRHLSNFIVDSFEKENNLEVSMKICKILSAMKRPSKDLKIRYDIPKKYRYGYNENKYLIYLQEAGIIDILTRKKNEITGKLVKIFNENLSSDDLPQFLLKNVFDSFKIEDLHPKMEEESNMSLNNLEKYTNCQKLSLYKTAKENNRDQLVQSFKMIEYQLILALRNVKICEETTQEIFEILKILIVLGVANQMGIVEECESSTVLNMLDFMVDAVKNNKHEGLSTKTRKILEHLFCVSWTS